MVQLEINSGIAPQRILQWLLEDVKAVPCNGDGKCFRLPGCDIILEEIPREQWMLGLPRTRVQFRGEEKACETYQHRFRMNFMSAGG